MRASERALFYLCPILWEHAPLRINFAIATVRDSFVALAVVVDQQGVAGQRYFMNRIRGFADSSAAER